MVTSGNRESGGYQRQDFRLITDAKAPTSEELSGRMRKYAITMGFRTACFLAMIWVPGVGRWILFACAVFLPYVAVLFANQAHTKEKTVTFEQGAPSDARQITTGADVVTGSVITDDDDPQSGEPEHRDRVA